MSDDLIVVFKKDVDLKDAENILNKFKEIDFHEGMDSSRGKAYFYRTGPKFIIKISDEKKNKFIKEIERISELYEVYIADYSTYKD
ncbi:MAG: hypothetical protein ACTSO9_07895 [Candidatus Helarchaeota archaeon]